MPRHVPRVLLAGQTQRERQNRRWGIRLRDFTITQKTKERYEKAVANLLPFLEEQPGQLAWARGDPVNAIADALSGLHHFWPAIRGQLRQSWRLFKSWRRVESPVRAAPLTVDLVRAFIARAIDCNQLAFATLVGLGFHCLLRTGELLAIRFGDIEWNSECGVISLHASKSGLRTGTMEAVAIRDPLVLQLVDALAVVRQPCAGDPLWVGSPQSFRDLFRSSCDFFNVGHLRFKPYSLRRGGATLLLQRNVPLEIILVTGRWKSVGVARLYLEDGLAQLPSLRLDSPKQQLISRYSSLTSSTAFRPC